MLRLGTVHYLHKKYFKAKLTVKDANNNITKNKNNKVELKTQKLNLSNIKIRAQIKEFLKQIFDLQSIVSEAQSLKALRLFY